MWLILYFDLCRAEDPDPVYGKIRIRFFLKVGFGFSRDLDPYPVFTRGGGGSDLDPFNRNPDPQFWTFVVLGLGAGMVLI